MIHSGTYYHITCDACGEAFGRFGISQAEEDLRYASRRARDVLEAAMGVES